MPYIDTQNLDENNFVDPNTFISACTDSDIYDLLLELSDHGYLPQNYITTKINNLSVAEGEYESALDKLHGKWNRLSEEEEKAIIDIAKKF